MKEEKLYLKIEQHRKNRSTRWRRPYYSFHIKTLRSQRLLKKIKKSIGTDIDLNEALSQFVISDITAFEVYFKDIFLMIFQEHKNAKKILINCHKNGLIKDKFDFEDLIKIQYDNFSLPEIILQYRNFQNLTDIDNTFSAILEKKFFKFLSEREFCPDTSFMFKLDENWNVKLKKYLNLRHILIHDFNAELRLDIKEISELHLNLLLFVLAADICLDFEFLTDNLDDKEMKRIRKIGYVLP